MGCHDGNRCATGGWLGNRGVTRARRIESLSRGGPNLPQGREAGALLSSTVGSGGPNGHTSMGSGAARQSSATRLSQVRLPRPAVRPRRNDGLLPSRLVLDRATIRNGQTLLVGAASVPIGSRAPTRSSAATHRRLQLLKGQPKNHSPLTPRSDAVWTCTSLRPRAHRPCRPAIWPGGFVEDQHRRRLLQSLATTSRYS